MSYRPSKKILYLIIGGVLLVIGVLWWLGSSSNSHDINADINASTTSAAVIRLIVEQIELKGGLQEFDADILPADYTEKDLLIAQSPTDQTLPDYAEAIRKSLLPFAAEQEHEGTIALRLLNTGESADYQTLLISQVAYENLVDILLNTPIPASAAAVHLELINSSNRLAVLLDSMVAIQDNPLHGLNAAYGYTAELPDFYRATQVLSNYFTEQGMVFTPEERLIIYVK